MEAAEEFAEGRLPAPDDAPVGALPGIGSVTQGWLAEVGIRTAGELRGLGSVET